MCVRACMYLIRPLYTNEERANNDITVDIRDTFLSSSVALR